jgi:hypothetical protein
MRDVADPSDRCFGSTDAQETGKTQSSITLNCRARTQSRAMSNAVIGEV